jgi:hypothetical protein
VLLTVFHSPTPILIGVPLPKSTLKYDDVFELAWQLLTEASNLQERGQLQKAVMLPSWHPKHIDVPPVPSATS